MPSALFITTVDITLEAFLFPFAGRLRAQGWRLDALAHGATANERIAGSFDARDEAAWTRSPLSPGSLTSAPHVRRMVREGGYDVVWAHTPVAAMLTRYALRKHVPGHPAVIYTAHGFHFYEGGSARTNRLYRSIERRAARWTDFLVTINREDFDAACTFGTIRADRVRYIPGIGVDVDAYRSTSLAEAQQVRRELNVPEDAVLVTMIAEFTANKRHDLALDALARVRDPRVVLALVGDGPLEAHVRAEVARRGLEARVRLAGYRRDLPAILAASDALLLCSEREGLNRSVLEAMAAGIPVIGTATRGIADAVSDAEGWIVPKDDPVTLAAAIDEAAADPAERDRRGAAAHERAVREFALEGVLEAYDALFAEALTLGADTPLPARIPYDSAKRALDVVFAVLLLVLLSPVLLLTALVSLLTMGSPVLFRQQRPGRYGRIFTMLKFRTMRETPGATDDVTAVASDAERLTGFGSFLRATSLDELPQLWNILRGEMSFIGPRPWLVEYLPHYTPAQARRHEVRPGITGWAQVNGRNELSWDERIALDVHYVDNRSFGLDLRILGRTILAVLKREGISAEGEATMRPFVEASALEGDNQSESDDERM
ncbi:MAG: glycosyltransferase [Actinobacteria bacterium]|nr:glycosyltransferase [Actinomycetota bacterium]